MQLGQEQSFLPCAVMATIYNNCLKKPCFHKLKALYLNIEQKNIFFMLK